MPYLALVRNWFRKTVNSQMLRHQVEKMRWTDLNTWPCILIIIIIFIYSEKMVMGKLKQKSKIRHNINHLFPTHWDCIKCWKSSLTILTTLTAWLSLLFTCSWCVVSALAPLSCGSRRIIQVDAAHWWRLRRDPPPPPHDPHDCK